MRRHHQLGGAGKWRPEYAEALKGAHVVVVADRDEPGRAHAADVARSLEGVAASVAVVEPAEGKDAADHLAAGLGVDAFVAVGDPDLLGMQEGVSRRHVVGRPASTIEPEPVRWADDNRVALGAVTLVAGREGMGKGAWVVHQVARWTRGQVAGDLLGQPVDVAMLSIEDDPARVLVPRLTVAGADLAKCHILSVRTEDGLEESPVLPDDVGSIADWLRNTGARVLVVDVPNAFMGGGFDAHKDHDVRRAVAGPLTNLAAALDIAVVLIVHLNRAPSTVVLDRIAGSLGLSRAARSVLAVVENPDAENERLVVLAKSNLGRLEVPSLKFRIEGAEVQTTAGPTSTARVVTLGECDAVTARNALRTATTDEERSAQDEAEDFLRELLAAGPVPAKDGQAEAREAGIATRTLARAKKSLGVRSKKLGQPGEKNQVWQWHLPEGENSPEDDQDTQDDGPKAATESEECRTKNTAPFDNLGNLRAESVACAPTLEERQPCDRCQKPTLRRGPHGSYRHGVCEDVEPDEWAALKRAGQRNAGTA